MHSDKEYLILEHINGNSSHTRQRDLAAADLSLGMTNAVLKKLVTKGLLVMKRVNSRNIHYALTPEGLYEVAQRSRALLKRTLSNVAQYRDAAERYVSSLKQEGCTAIQLQGSSDLDFILEWACMKHEMLYNPAVRPDSQNPRQKELDEQELITVLETYINNERGLLLKTALITGITGQDGSYLGIKRRASSFNTERVDHIYQDPHETPLIFTSTMVI